LRWGPCLFHTSDNPVGLAPELLAASRAEMLIDLPAYLAKNVRPFFAPNMSKAMTDWVLAQAMSASLKAAIETNTAVCETDWRPDLKAVAVLTLVIHGDADRSAPLELTGRQVANRIAQSRLIVYAGAPHGLPITHVERLNADLLNFMNT
jgi:non-heme chloroperoxidase